MLRDIVKLTQIEPKFWAGLFGVAPEQFYEWMAGARSIPKFLLPELASVFGVLPSDIVENRQLGHEFEPAIWYKLRSQQRTSTSADLETVGLVRKLCFNYGELQALLKQTSDECGGLFQKIRTEIDQSASIGSQAREAAAMFKSELGWLQGSGVIGEFIRPRLRRAGLVIVESSVSDSQIEGCSFRVRSERDIPCVFANSYQSTWFRRNAVILHEISHCIFDLEGDPVSVDYQHENSDDLREKRANLFAQECLVPTSALTYMTNKFGVKWAALSAELLAKMVAESTAEQRLILRAALNQRMITPDQHDRYLTYECTPLLKEFSQHALPAREFLATVPKDQHRWFFQDRFVKVGNRGILLPVAYLKTIIELISSGRITIAKAAELTMMDSYAFQERFRQMIPEAA
jgi:Zn-dependent peptidase ImmA (M78 family)